MIELYDVAKTLYGRVPNIFKLIRKRAQDFESSEFAAVLKESAWRREEENYSIPQDQFSAMCDIWVQLHQMGDLYIDPEAVVFPDTIPRFQKVKEEGRRIGIMTSGTPDYIKILFGAPLPDGGILHDLVDAYYFGDEIGDKDHWQTWKDFEARTGETIDKLFDDKPTVVRAAANGLRMSQPESGDALPWSLTRAQMYLVDRKAEWDPQTYDDLAYLGVHRIRSFDDV